MSHLAFDIGSSTLEELVNETELRGAKTVLSFHAFDKTPDLKEMQRVLEKQIRNRASIAKVVTTARELEDNLTIFELIERAKKRVNIVSFAMGEKGKSSRLLSPIFGAYFTFASLESGHETGPGQMSVQDMKAVYKIMGFD